MAWNALTGLGIGLIKSTLGVAQGWVEVAPLALGDEMPWIFTKFQVLFASFNYVSSI